MIHGLNDVEGANAGSGASSRCRWPRIGDRSGIVLHPDLEEMDTGGSRALQIIPRLEVASRGIQLVCAEGLWAATVDNEGQHIAFVADLVSEYLTGRDIARRSRDLVASRTGLFNSHSQVSI